MLGLLGILGGGAVARAEDGYDLWLRYRNVEAPWRERYLEATRELVSPPGVNDAARSELSRALTGLLGSAPAWNSAVTRDGALVLGTMKSSGIIKGLVAGLEDLGDEGYVLKSARSAGTQSHLHRGEQRDRCVVRDLSFPAPDADAAAHRPS